MMICEVNNQDTQLLPLSFQISLQAFINFEHAFNFNRNIVWKSIYSHSHSRMFTCVSENIHK